jgi:hypothetical protein
MAKSVKFSSLNLDVTLFFNYAPFLLLGLVFLRIVGMLCVGFRFHFAQVSAYSKVRTKGFEKKVTGFHPM